MTPKEQAKELFDKYCYAIKTEVTDSGYFTNVIYAKKCALIAVDEILESHNKLFTGVKTSIYKYYEEVKQEIELL